MFSHPEIKVNAFLAMFTGGRFAPARRYIYRVGVVVDGVAPDLVGV